MFVDRISETAPRPSRRPTITATFAVALILFAGSFTAEATDQIPPTTPGNFRVTAKTAYSVTLAWNPSTDNSGNFNYHLWGAYGVGPTVILPKRTTRYTFTALYPGNSYTFGIYARDAAGNISEQVTLSTTTLLDTTPPSTAPAVSVTELGSNYASLAWTPAQDDGPYLFYEVWLNGSFYVGTGRNITSVILRFLAPETTYTVTVRAYDYGNNRGPFSNPLSVRTLPPNPNDHTPPTTPTDLREDHYAGGDTEISLWWTQSTDDFDKQANIRYDVYVNGVLQDVLFGSGGRSIVYGEAGENTIEVIASDTAGNASEPATIIVFF